MEVLEVDNRPNWPISISGSTGVPAVKMALLYRFTRINDRCNTGIFTFIVTRSVTRDQHRDVTTKDFTYNYHKWAVSFTRTEKLMGVFLILRTLSPGSKCLVDFTFTLLNREHFSKNENFTEKQKKFTVDQAIHGNNKWVTMSDLVARRFTDENGEFLIELTLGNIVSTFETDIKVSHLPFSSRSNNLESAYFTFGGYEWNVTIQTKKDDPEFGNRPRVLLNRLTGFDHPCRVQYQMVLGEGERRMDSGLVDQISDMNGQIRGFGLRCQVNDLIRRGHLRLHVIMICANTVSEATVPTKTEPAASGANCYDREKQGWCVEADMEGEFLKLKLFCSDLHLVPRSHLRYVSWNAYVMRRHTNSATKDSILVICAPHWSYYVQDGMDMGMIMETDIPIKDIKESPNLYLESNGNLTVHIEWLESILLFNSSYHKYDDIFHLHCHQMKREISALQAENYYLERQLFSYQKSISLANSRGQASEDLTNEYYPEGHQPYYERSLSEGQSFSETEYA